MVTYITVSVDDLAAYAQELTNGASLQQMADNILGLQSSYGTLSAMMSDLRSDVSTLQSNMTQVQSDIGELATRVSQLETEISDLQNRVTVLENP